MINTTIDVRGKLGKISKTIQVYSNDPGRPQVTLTLSINVRDVMHSKKQGADEIFKKTCSRCHVDSGRGQKGLALFIADCAMCHNYDKTASPAERMKNISEEKLRKDIEEGVNGSSMPGWAVNKGGPLTPEELDSLIEFIKKGK